MGLPPAILFDLDDTLISAHLHPRKAWTKALQSLDGLPGDPTVEEAAETGDAATKMQAALRGKNARKKAKEARDAADAQGNKAKAAEAKANADAAVTLPLPLVPTPSPYP